MIDQYLWISIIYGFIMIFITDIDENPWISLLIKFHPSVHIGGSPKALAREAQALFPAVSFRNVTLQVPLGHR